MAAIFVCGRLPVGTRRIRPRAGWKQITKFRRPNQGPAALDADNGRCLYLSFAQSGRRHRKVLRLGRSRTPDGMEMKAKGPAEIVPTGERRVIPNKIRATSRAPCSLAICSWWSHLKSPLRFWGSAKPKRKPETNHFRFQKYLIVCRKWVLLRGTGSILLFRDQGVSTNRQPGIGLIVRRKKQNRAFVKNGALGRNTTSGPVSFAEYRK